MLLECPEAPRRGTYVEVCRGRHRLVARVVWNRKDQVGLIAQDRLPVDSIICEASDSKAATSTEDRGAEERRSADRVRESQAQEFARSRFAARGFQFVAVAAFGASAAVGAYATVRQTLACPMSSVAAALSGKAALACN
jgi:hypothetical protein